MKRGVDGRAVYKTRATKPAGRDRGGPMRSAGAYHGRCRIRRFNIHRCTRFNHSCCNRRVRLNDSCHGRSICLNDPSSRYRRCGCSNDSDRNCFACVNCLCCNCSHHATHS
jgi:hypothetical protein